MHLETIQRARTIIKRQEIYLCDDSTERIKHFQVKQRDGEWIDVWYRNGRWSCNSVTTKKDGKRWGCVMNVNRDWSKPMCSHSYAAFLLLKEIEVFGGIEECQEVGVRQHPASNFNDGDN